jgi:hypothetical protein
VYVGTENEENPRCSDRLLKRTRILIVPAVFASCLENCTLERTRISTIPVVLFLPPLRQRQKQETFSPLGNGIKRKEEPDGVLPKSKGSKIK